MIVKQNSIPQNWTLSTIGEVCTQPQYGYTTSGVDSGNLRLLRTTDITKGNIDWGTVPFCQKNPEDEEKYLLKDGDIVISRAGSIGVSYLIKNPQKSVFASYLIRFRPFINLSYFKYFLDSPFYWQQISENRLGIAVPNVNATKLQTIPIPLPPTNEQKRIVAKIEELFSELDKGIESLKTAREQLKVYRQAVLKHAFEGKLTAGWREQNKEKIEAADQLLKRIKHRREAQYQQQLKKWQLAVKAWDGADKKAETHTKPKVLEIPQLFTAEELLQLPVLKNEWVWTKIAEIFSVYVGSTPSRKQQTYWGGNIFWVSSGEVAFCRIAKTRETITQEGYLNTSTEIHPPGTIMLAMIGEGKTRGQVAILDVEAAHNQNTAAIRVKDTECIPEYLYYFFVYQYEKTRTVGSGNNQKALNKERVSNMAFPLAPIAEQIEIVREVESVFSIVQSLESEIEANLLQSEALRQSILKKAFSGKLVAQDPNDEPASILLERIRAKKEAQSGKKKPKQEQGADSILELAAIQTGVVQTSLF